MLLCPPPFSRVSLPATDTSRLFFIYLLENANHIHNLTHTHTHTLTHTHTHTHKRFFCPQPPPGTRQPSPIFLRGELLSLTFADERAGAQKAQFVSFCKRPKQLRRSRTAFVWTLGERAALTILRFTIDPSAHVAPYSHYQPPSWSRPLPL